MNTKIVAVLLAHMIFTGLLNVNAQGKIEDFNRDEITALLFRVADWQSEQTDHIARYDPLNWHFAAYYIGVMKMYHETGEKKYLERMYALGKEHKWRTLSNAYDADRIAVGQMYLDVYREKQEAEIITHLQWVLDDHLKRKPKADVRFNENPYAREWWSWCDALFMAPPAFAKMWEVTGRREYLEYAIEHWMITTDYLWDNEENLIYRDDRFFDSRTSSGHKVFWSRGNGWVFAGLAHMLEMIPPDHPKRADFVEQFKGMAAKLAAIQGEDGMWRPSLLDAEQFPQPETSGSAFFCYGMLWGMNNGLLSQDEYEPVVMKAWNALVQQVNGEGRLGHVQPPGKEPGNYTADEWHEYGTGAFLLAGSELLNLLVPGPERNNFEKGSLLYKNKLAAKKDVSDWIMEGPGNVEFRDQWMHMYSPDEEMHHVFWCPEDFPGNFIAEWEMQNMKPDAGLCIIFFSARGMNGESIFDPSFPPRDGTFRQYNRSDHFNCYHISYYANAKPKPGREISHLRKNSGFHKVHIGKPGIPTSSKDSHQITMIKDRAHILMFVDDRKIIDWTDDGRTYGPVLEDGKMGFRQMQWTHFRYRDFQVWEIRK